MQHPVKSLSGIPLGLGAVVSVSCGQDHSVAVCASGQVFSWGLNSHGQLGLGKRVSLQPIPALVRSLTGVPVTQVAAGGPTLWPSPSQAWSTAVGRTGLGSWDSTVWMRKVLQLSLFVRYLYKKLIRLIHQHFLI
uniref:Uncharacterized protein n=1 Tax=Oncorhynchus tshawytscha TaxID=74940 RepID=A0AAZ3Q5A0_ONCTS